MTETFEVDGIVMPGDGKGTELGFPTANLALGSGIPPTEGVWAGWARLGEDETKLPAAIHVGPRPTFDDDAPRFEVFLIDFEPRGLYGQSMKVSVVAKMRDVAKFDSLAELTQQMEQDVVDTRKVLGL